MMVLRSAWIPAPPLGSEPAMDRILIVMTSVLITDSMMLLNYMLSLCSNCYAEISSDSLYCEFCGGEVCISALSKESHLLELAGIPLEWSSLQIIPRGTLLNNR